MSHTPESRLSRWIRKYKYLNIALIYLGTALVVIHFAEAVVHGLHMPALTFSLIVILSLAGLPIVLIIAWAIDNNKVAGTGQDIKSKKSNRSWIKKSIAIIISISLFIGAIFLYRKYFYHPVFTGDDRSIAVLPFTNLSSDKENEYFSDGMTDEINIQLSKIPDLKVIARTSSMSYKGSAKSIKEIARDLDVASILEGSVQKKGTDVKITARLIDANTQEYIWAGTYEKDFRDIFSIQNEVAIHIAEALKSQLFNTTDNELTKRKETGNTEAYNLLLKGRYYLNKGKKEDLVNARLHFEQAIAKDGEYARAYAGLADTYILEGEFEYEPGKIVWPRAEIYARKALKLDPGLADAHNSLGHLSIHLYKWSEAESELNRAIELSPTHAEAHQFLSQYHAVMGRMNESIAEILKAQELDPLSLLVSTNVAQQFFRARRYEAALEQLNKTLELQADYPRTYRNLGRVYLAKGMHSQAISAFEKALSFTKDNPIILSFLGYARARAGERSSALEILDKLKTIGTHRDISGEIALVYIGLSEYDSAFEWLEKAVAEYSVMTIQLKVDPEFDSIRMDPRYPMILEKMGLH